MHGRGGRERVQAGYFQLLPIATYDDEDEMAKWRRGERVLSPPLGSPRGPSRIGVGVGQEEMTETFSKTNGNLNTDYLQLSIT